MSYTHGTAVISVTACKQVARSLTGRRSMSVHSVYHDRWAPTIYRSPTMELMICASSLPSSVSIHIHVGESMDATALANCQTHARTSIAIDGWRLVDQVRKLRLAKKWTLCLLTSHVAKLITASGSERLLFSPFCNEQWWQFVGRMLPCLWSWKWRALAGFCTKWWFAVVIHMKFARYFNQMPR